MNITKEEFDRAVQISQAIKKYFRSTGKNQFRSTELYEYLARKGLTERDNNNGVQFRNFLKKLKDKNLLYLIPQCKPDSTNKYTKWFFYPVSNIPSYTYLGHKPTLLKDNPPIIAPLTKEEVKELIEKAESYLEELSQKDDIEFLPQELWLRKFYPRAYEIWTPKETKLMNRAYELTQSVFATAKILKRQPHIVEEKLRAYNRT